FYLETPDGGTRAVATIWNCPVDRRVLWIFSFISGSKGAMLATHQRIVESVQCHTGGDRPTTRPVFPNFIPPPGYARDTSPGEMLFAEPKQQSIVFEAGVTD